MANGKVIKPMMLKVVTSGRTSSKVTQVWNAESGKKTTVTSPKQAVTRHYEEGTRIKRCGTNLPPPPH